MIATRKNFVILLLLIGIFAPDVRVSALPGAQYSKYKKDSTKALEKPASLSDILVNKELLDVPYRGLSRDDRNNGQEECKQHWESIYSVLTGRALESAFKVYLGGNQGISSAQFFKCFDFLNSVCDKSMHLRGRPIRIDLTISKDAELSRATELSSESDGCFYSLNIGASSTKIVQFIQLAGWKLSELDLSWNDMGADGTAAVVRSLANQADLKVLKLEDNKIEQEGATKLAAIFNSENFAPKFSELDLSWNRMGTDGTAAVVRSLAKQADLKVLKLGYNGIEQEGATELAEIFNSNDFKPKLSELKLYGNDIEYFSLKDESILVFN